MCMDEHTSGSTSHVKSPLHWVLCSENWKDLMIIAVPELNTHPIESNYSDVSTQDIKRSYFD